MDPWEKKSKSLMQALIVSGALNIAFAGTLVAFSLKKGALEKIEGHPQEVKLVSLYLPLSFDELLECLKVKTVVEHGYLERDIALALLVEFHHFNLERALSGVVFEKRPVMFIHPEGGEEVRFTLFPGLSDGHFEALLHYAHKEKWPLSTQGLFLELKRGNQDPSLLETFKLSREMDEMSSLFKKKEVLSMVLEGDFEALSLSKQNPLEVLTRYIRLGSKNAIKLFFEFEGVERVDNGFLLFVLSQVEELTPGVEEGLRLIVNSPRPDQVRRVASKLLSQATGAPVVFVPKDPVKHVVVQGDTLWEISKKYRVSIDRLCEINHLERGRMLKIGQEIKICEKGESNPHEVSLVTTSR